ncbi:hypothetical protein [uncultured Stenotrophomonas sp.]|uniref:hypothetical protein n=1 Tax=uncultured Stenotrophomonas sp. TaxID=165438 RepID=UPI0025FFA27D|nr:hypothetical protein [uncultured Stenotrophomonas sp.]
MKIKLFLAAPVLALSLLSSAVTIATEKLPADPTMDPLMRSAGFLSSHPDLRFRLLGLEKLKNNEPEKAFTYFKRAAYYSDKPSQGMVAEMLWNGQGVTADRSLAYAWMDLAAERGYAGFAGLRERYWAQLDDIERERAVELGQEVYAHYGDEAASPRLARVLHRGQQGVTGSRLGSAGALTIYVPGPDGEGMQISGSKFYDRRYWDPQLYQQWHDQVWMKPRIGSVNVGAASQIPPSINEHRIPKVQPQIDAEEPATDDAMPNLQGGNTKP